MQASCFHCQYMGNNFDQRIISAQSTLITCPKCQKETLIFLCNNCNSNNFLDKSYFNTKIFKCKYDQQSHFRIFNCMKCKKLQVAQTQSQIQQGWQLICFNCKTKGVYLNCPKCEYVIIMGNVDNPLQIIKCPQCQLNFQYRSCDIKGCGGDCFCLEPQNKPTSFICQKNLEHKQTLFSCYGCMHQYFIEDYDKLKENQSFQCIQCKRKSLVSHCQKCNYKNIMITPQYQQKQDNEFECGQCGEIYQMISCQDPRCINDKNGVSILKKNWYEQVKINKDQRPNPFMILDCIGCKVKRALVVCKNCDNRMILNENDAMVKCSSCNKHFETQKEKQQLDMNCQVCLEKRKEVVFRDCGHIFCCEECARKTVAQKAQCPVCRGQILGIQKIYFS